MNKKSKSTFVLSDIHGCADELEALLKKIPLIKGSQIIFLGDYVDRGPNSKKVIDIILDLKTKYEVIALKGNHEKMFLDFLRNKDTPEALSFIYNGGGATLASYSDPKTGQYEIPKTHIKFFDSLKLYYETDDYIFVHAGLPNVEIQDLGKRDYENTFLWVRDNFFKSDFKWEKLIIHGHTCVEEVEQTKKRINIDTACAYGGKLTALQLPEMEFYHVNKKREEKLYYLKYRKDQSGKRKSVRYYGNIPVTVINNEEIGTFITVDYNEFGMLIHEANETEETTTQLRKGQKIAGHLNPGKNKDQMIPFEGEVIRTYDKSIGNLYAVRFIEPPFIK